MTTPAYQRERRRLAEALKARRVAAGLSGARLSEMLGWQQSKVSKIETRKQLPSEEDIAAWVGATGGSPETASELLAALRGARVEYAAWKDTYRDSGADGVQADILELEVAVDEDRRVPAQPDLGTPPDRRLRAGVPAPAVRPAQLRRR